MTHIMLDFETWGVTPRASLRSIGAVVFDPKTGILGDPFYANISRESCAAFGLVEDQSTIDWWDKQSAKAQEALEIDQMPLDEALKEFLAYWKASKGQYIWSHGANFDEVIMRNALTAVGMEAPWQFWDVRCCRTVLALGNRKPMREGGTHHNALDDAVAQAKAVAAALRTGIKL